MNRQENFPLTFGLMKDIHYKKAPEIREATWFGISHKMVAPNNLDKWVYLKARVDEVEEPIWSLVEDILSGGYDSFQRIEGKEDSHIVWVGDQEFNICKVYHMFVETCITPDVTNNSTEHNLLRNAFQKAIDYEENGKYRELLTGYYEEKV